MDFFEAQARAKKRTTRLVVLFVLAVLGIIAAGYFAAVLLVERSDVSRFVSVNISDDGQTLRQELVETAFTWWHPRLLTGVALGTLAVVGLASLKKWLQFRAGGRAVAEMVGAREVPLQTTDLRERQLLNVVEEMAIASGLPLPSVYVLDDETGINAFAAGLTTSDAVVAVTRGTLEKLNRDELQGVIAHEFSHILNGDMRLNVRLTAVLHGILVIGLLGRGILGSLRFSRSRRGGKEGNGIFVLIAAGLVLVVLGYVGYFFGRLIQAAVSRQREFLADASAVQFTRNPAGITGALKKIGGYALGSRIQTTKAAELGHFFFAQGFRSSFGGLWATHPPLNERIQAVDPAFDGQYFEPAKIVDVATESWGAHQPRPAPAPRQRLDPITLIASIGTLNTGQIDAARDLTASIPPELRAALQTPTGAAAVACGLLLERDTVLRARQLELVRRHAGEAVNSALALLQSSLAALPPEARLPLLLLTPPALRRLAPADLARLLETLDELVHADNRVSVFEFALQKVLARHLDLSARPQAQREVHSPSNVSAELSAVLSFGARLGATDEADALRAFTAGATRFSGLHPALVFCPASPQALDQLDNALDKLALAHGPVKKRLLVALSETVAHDGHVDPPEADLIRALASALDCPMPPT